MVNNFSMLEAEANTSESVTQSIDELNPYSFAGQTHFAPTQYSIFDGEKFPGGFGPTQLQTMDYWTMRKRSAQLFNENLYARGLIRRLITNEINTGLTPEATPEADILNISEDVLNEWSELIETRFSLWANSAALCDYRGLDNFGAIQRTARREALIEGDVLVIIRYSHKTKLPTIQLINGGQVRSPLAGTVRKGHTVKRGVEKNSRGVIVAYWVQQRQPIGGPTTQMSGKIKRIPAFGEKSGRRIAWLEYGTDKRVFEDRGVPLLGILLQSLKEIDRYRDSAQRKAVINSILAMFIYKKEDKLGTLPMTGGAARKDSATVTDGDGTTRDFNIANHIPGVVFDELQTGEEPKGFQSNGTDTSFPVFEEAVIAAMAWSIEMPPEIARLSFSNNYSASQAAINEFKIYLNLVWGRFGSSFCKLIYIEWLLAEALLQKIKAPELLESWRDPSKYDMFAAWTSVEWYGSIKPSTDMLKQAKGSELLVKHAWSNNAREARGLTGTKFTRNTRRLKRENVLLADAMSPLIEAEERLQAARVASVGRPEGAQTVVDAQALENTEEILTAIEDLTS